jgi:hypothetical protein
LAGRTVQDVGEAGQFGREIVGWPVGWAATEAASHQSGSLGQSAREELCSLFSRRDLVRHVDPHPKAPGGLAADIARPDARPTVLPDVTGNEHMHIEEETFALPILCVRFCGRPPGSGVQNKRMITTVALLPNATYRAGVIVRSP